VASAQQSPQVVLSCADTGLASLYFFNAIVGRFGYALLSAT